MDSLKPLYWSRREPAPPAFGKDKIVPEDEASFLTFNWLAPLLYVGASRPLEKDDLWTLPSARRSTALADLIETNFYSRVPPQIRPATFRDARQESGLTEQYAETRGGRTTEEGGDAEKAGDAFLKVTEDSEPPTPELSRSASTKLGKESWFLRAFSRFKYTTPPSGDTPEDLRKQKYPKRPLLSAVHSAFFWRWWIAGSLKLCAGGFLDHADILHANLAEDCQIDTLNTTSPLVTRLLLAWLTEAFTFAHSGSTSPRPRGIGYGVGLGVALFAMQEVSSLMTNHFMMSAPNFTSLRRKLRVDSLVYSDHDDGLMCANWSKDLIFLLVIGSIFRKSLRLSGRARTKHSVGQVTTMISADATRLDLSSQYIHNLWVAPIQIIIGIALLINNLGYSALVGLGVIVLGFPVQIVLVRIMYAAMLSGVKITDRRVRLTSEVLQGIRLIKFYAWEAFYAHQIGGLREKEIAKNRRVAIASATMISVVTAIPILASVLSFVTYALSGHNLNAAIIFSSLQFFNIIRAPLLFLPFVLSSASDAVVALGRIGEYLNAEELEEPYVVDRSSTNTWAIRVEGDFTWETVERLGGDKFEGFKAEENESAKGIPVKSEKGANDDAKGATSGARRRWWSRKNKVKGKETILPTSSKPPVSSTSSTTAHAPLPHTEDSTKNEKGLGEHDDEKPFALTSLRLRIPKGAFVAIVGRVGSGKSSLLQSLVGEMRKVDGEVYFPYDLVSSFPSLNRYLQVVFGGSVAYVPQQAWIMNATLRENILFGQEDDEEKESFARALFSKTSKCCPNGAQTEIGEKGINLSGGQKARVSLARAAYSASDIILLDDPLSAVDAHVGKAILEDCFVSGPLADKTRILVTHALHVLARTDYIYVMDGGVITEEGTYQDLMKDGKAFSQLIEEYGVLENEEGDEASESPDARTKPTANSQDIDSPEKPQDGKVKAQLMSEEERNRGAVPFSIYNQYLKHAGGAFWAPVIILLLTLMQGASVGNNLFLGFWTAESIHGFSESDYMGVYSALGIAQAVFSFIVSFTFSMVGLYASLRLFKAALTGVLRSPVSFFDTTPMDQDTLDTQLSMVMFQLLSTFSNVLGTVALVFYTFPYLGIIFVPLSMLYYLVSKYYRKSSVETKRLDSLMRSALYASYSETLTGLATVRAYREQPRFVDNAERGLDLENRAYYMTVSIQRIALFAAGFRKTVSPSSIGVVLSYSLSITQVFSEMVSQYALNEQNMNAVERVLVYVDLPREGAAATPLDPPATWPEKGAVAFRNVELAYRAGLPLVLKGVDFEVRPGEKVGIVGRTGAGKSSLLQALFRMVELSSGSIEIDGVDIRHIGLDVLRRQLALVPQDSTLFLGTLRENLDPQKTCTDAEILSALRRSWLLPAEGTPIDPAVEAKFSLESAVGDEGANFSAGEKQLLALCRALLKGSRIIVLDEATSSVDVGTDAKLQQTIQREFAGCTLLCIAHRLNTIVYYDRVLVMDGGAVAEFDTPLGLFDREDSIFRSLCEEAGLSRADIVRIRGGEV
ncbi:multidrug resistance-associated ABC transporter [Phellopilus nigrolimitatus]|nr:multidrug resistance-associated ABC transporter [Phellopilus nigrolimitatus]